MNDLSHKLKQIGDQLPPTVKLVAVSKTRSAETVQLAYDAGQRAFGENRVQELEQKAAILPKDIEWHMIGHLQTNKVKFIAPFVTLIHSVDDSKLLSVIEKEAAKCGRRIQVLLEFHIAKEETKHGLSLDEAHQLLRSEKFGAMKHVEVVGVMGMATFTSDESLIRSEFRYLHEVFLKLRSEFFADDPNFKELSMGMSGDFRIAIEEGSTMVRIGSSIFGNRS